MCVEIAGVTVTSKILCDIGAPQPLTRSRSLCVMGRLSMLHWFDSFYISPVFSNSVNINYFSDVQIAVRPYDNAFVHRPRSTVPW